MPQIHGLSQFSASKVLSFGEDLGEVFLKVAMLFLSSTNIIPFLISINQPQNKKSRHLAGP